MDVDKMCVLYVSMSSPAFLVRGECSFTLAGTPRSIKRRVNVETCRVDIICTLYVSMSSSPSCMCIHFYRPSPKHQEAC